jgi:O-antigen/teichoic acid export membrane protein
MVWKMQNLQRRSRILLTFMGGQGAAQGLNLLCGLLILRWLPMGDYSQYGLVYGYQMLVNSGLDLGFSGTIVALVGHRINDKSVIGNYIRAGRRMRLKMMGIVLPVLSVVYYFMTKHMHWPLYVQVMLLLSICASVNFSGLQSYYTSPLLIHRRLTTYYRILILTSLLRLVACFVLYSFGWITSVTAVWVNVLGIAVTGFLLRAACRDLVDEPARPSREITRQMLRYTMPNMPGLLFYALQGQVSVFLIATFGNSKGLAQVSALGRVGQIFTLLYSINVILVEPWFAKSDSRLVLKRYLGLAGIVVLGSALLVGLTARFPEILLLLLGQKYYNLRVEVVWLVLQGCIGFLMGMTWTVVSARRLIFWRTTFLNIFGITLSQIAFIFFFGVTSPLRAIQMGCFSVSISLCAQLYNLFYGLKRGPRIHIEPEETKLNDKRQEEMLTVIAVNAEIAD